MTEIDKFIHTKIHKGPHNPMEGVDLNLVNFLHLSTSCTESRGKSRTELALLTSLFSPFLSVSVFPPPQQMTA